MANAFAARTLSDTELETLKTLLRRVVDGLTANTGPPATHRTEEERSEHHDPQEDVRGQRRDRGRLRRRPAPGHRPDPGHLRHAPPIPKGCTWPAGSASGLLAIGLTTLAGPGRRRVRRGPGDRRALSVSYRIGVVLALWGDARQALQRPLGWIAVGLNLLLGAGFAYLQLDRPRTARAAGRP